jgi:hypothetical protein
VVYGPVSFARHEIYARPKAAGASRRSSQYPSIKESMVTPDRLRRKFPTKTARTLQSLKSLQSEEMLWCPSVGSSIAVNDSWDMARWKGRVQQLQMATIRRMVTRFPILTIVFTKRLRQFGAPLLHNERVEYATIPSRDGGRYEKQCLRNHVPRVHRRGVWKSALFVAKRLSGNTCHF